VGTVVGLIVAVGVRVAVDEDGVREGVTVGDVTVGVPIGVAMDVPVGVSVDVPVGVSVDVPVGVSVDVPVGVSVDVPVGVNPPISQVTVASAQSAWS